MTAGARRLTAAEPLTYSWARTGGTSSATGTLTRPTTATPDFTAETRADGAEDVTHILTLTVTDSANVTATDTVTITVTSGFVNPVAEAGDPRSVGSGATVTLDGGRSTVDSRRTPLTYSWARTGGTSSATGTLTRATTATPDFTAETRADGAEDVTHILTLTVTDSANVTATDTVTITVTSGFVNPVAEAGDPRSVGSGATVTLDGGRSTVDSRRTPLTYSWARTGGTSSATGTLTRATTATPDFTAETRADGAEDVTHILTLTVTDSANVTATDTVTITVTSGFVNPVAEAGDPRSVGSGATVTLDGGRSTVDSRRTPLTYSWARTGGTSSATGTLTRPTTATPDFTAETRADGAEDVTHILTLTVTDSANVTATDTVTITVTSGFAAPVAEAGDPRSVGSGATVTLDGGRSTVDSRRTPLTYSWARTGGTSSATGTLTRATTATPDFTAETRADGAEDVTHILTLTVTDSANVTATDTVTITVTSGFVNPVAEAGDPRSVGSGATVTLDGGRSTVDSRRTPLTYSWARTGGTSSATGTLTRATTATPDFTAETRADGAEDVTHILTLTVTDSANVTATDTVTITVTSGFVNPVAEAGDPRSVGSGATVTLDGGRSTVDSRRTPLTYSWARTGGTSSATGTLTRATTATPDFTAETRADGAEDVTHILTLTVTDSANVTATDTVTITVTSGFAAPVAEAGDPRSVGSGATVTLDGGRSTVDSRRTPLTYSWARTGGTSSATGTLTRATTATPGFTAETRADGAEDVTHILTLTVTDSANVTATDTVTITVTSGFVNPVAEAGDPRSVGSGATVTLDGGRSTVDSRRTPLTYSWARTGGTSSATGTLTRATTATPGFTAETRADGAEDVTHILTLTVTDSANVTATDTVTITVTSGFVNPVAEAGDPRSVGSGATVTLDGGRSTVDSRRTPLTYSWARTGGTSSATGTLTRATTATPDFTAETRADGAEDVTHILTLTVTDSANVTATDTVTITVTSGFVNPVAEAGDPRSVGSGATVTLDGGRSTVDSRRTPLTYSWARTGGTSSATGTLTRATTATPGFTAETRADGAEDVTHILTLTVTDSANVTATDTVTITVTSGFVNPVAEAGDPRSVGSGATVTLDGGRSTVDSRRTPLTYSWARTGGTSSATGTLTRATTATPDFTAETRADGAEDVTHILTLTVTDSANVTATDTVTITVTSGFVNPVAEAGDPRSVGSGATVTLDGGRSTVDSRRTPLTYSWARTGGTSSATGTLTRATTATPDFTAETRADGAEDVTHILTLTVTDSANVTATDTVTITVTSGFVNPVAEAGDPRSVGSGATVTLDGGRSTVDSRRTPLTYSWARTGGTSSATGTLTRATTATPDFTAETRADGAEDVTHILTLTVTDSANVTATDTVTITVTSGFVNPVAEAGDPRSVGSGATVTLDGGRSTVDSRRTPLTYSWARTGGTSSATGTLTRPTTATPDFTAETRADGAEDVTHILTLTVTDSANVTATDTVTITVTSGFVNPVAEAGDPRSVGSGATVTLDGGRSTVDSRRTPLTYSWARTGGTSSATGTLTRATTATPDFTAETRADGAEDVTHILTLTVTDSANVTATDTVTITVTSGFVNPVAEAGDPRSVGSGATVTLDGGRSTVDSRRTPLTYSWARTGGTSSATGTLTRATTATPDFTAETRADGAEDVTHILTLTVTDSANVTATDTVTITVTSGFVNPVAEAGDPRSVGSGATVTLDGGRSTVDSRRTPLTYSWARTGGTSSATGTLTRATTATPDFTAETRADGAEDVTHILTLTVTDSANVTATDTVTITVTSGFVNPVAEAGDPRSVGSGATVTLDGGRSTVDSRRTPLTYSWARTGGTSSATGTLTRPTTATPDFTAETRADGAEDVTHILTLTVTDSANVTATDTVTITVTSGFAAPVAEAGDPRSVGSGATVTLDGGRSTVDSRRTPLTYSWARTGGTSSATGTLTRPTTATPGFTAETRADGTEDVTHILTLTVTDSANVTATDTVTITVTSGFVNPVAEAGDPRSVGSGATVTLDGGRSTVDSRRTPLTYSWARTGGTSSATGTLTRATTATPDFTAETRADGTEDVTHILTLTVTDSANVTATDTVTITVTSGFVNPVAEAGDPRSVGSGATVTLDGGRSTVDSRRTPLTYSWARTGGTSSATGTLTRATTATPDFTAETRADGAEDVTHILTLTVTDSANVTATDTVTITVTSGFAAPVAEAGDPRSVGSGATVTLDGGRSTVDSRRTPLTYSWARTGGTSSATGTLIRATTATPDFTAETRADGAEDVTHILTLTVTDSANVTATDTVTITVTSGFAAPVAMIAGGDREVASGAAVQLDGSGSTFDSRATVTYDWDRTGGNGDATVTLTGEDTARLSFTADALAPGAADLTHEFTLTVTDNQGGRSTATVTITVEAPPLGPLVAEAGDARSVVSGTQGVQLDGTGSTLTGGGRAVTYLWDRTGGDGATVTLTDADTLQPSFTAQTLAPGDAAVTYIFTLTVTDDQSSAAATDTVTITVVPVDTLDSPFELIGVSPLLFGLIVSAVDILVSTSELTVQEGGSSAYQVRLSESPGQDVTVTAVSDNENVVLENAQLTFNANNWDAWQEIRIGTVADSENADGKTLIEHRLDTEGVALRQSGVVSVTVREEDPVLRPVGENLTARATTLLNNLPNLSSFLKQDRTTPGGSGGFTFKATNGHLTLDGGFVRDGVWGEIAGSYTKSDFGDTRFVLGSFGIHRKYSERFLAGAMLQIDLADHDLDGKSGSIDGTGWLVGPYFAARHGTWPLYFEGRLLYGQSDNDIRFNDSDLGEKMRMGSFDTTRMLAQLRLEGEIALSDGDEGPRLIPYADTRWFEDRAAAFTDSIGTRISGQTVSISQLELGSNVEVPIAMSHGALTFTGGLGLVYSKTEGDYIPSVSRSRGRGEIGFSYGLDDTVRIDFESFYDGIGTSGYEGYGLSLNAEIKF